MSLVQWNNGYSTQKLDIVFRKPPHRQTVNSLPASSVMQYVAVYVYVYIVDSNDNTTACKQLEARIYASREHSICKIDI